MSAPANAPDAQVGVVIPLDPDSLDWEEVPAIGGLPFSAGMQICKRRDGRVHVRTVDRPHVMVTFSPAQWIAFARWCERKQAIEGGI